MKGKYYIHGSAAISPQESFSGHFVPEERRTATNMLLCKEPDYSGFISPNSLRRMSRVLKMGLVAALKCLQNAGATVPDAIITGTGKGSLQDTERFLKNIREYAETALNPTPFIQSTYNSVNGLIALQQQCTRYNNTFVHRGFSFEHALLDGMMQLNEGAGQVLVGAFDEMTEEHFYIKGRIGFWKEELTQPAELLQSTTPGTIAGEGAAFFLLTKEPSNVCIEGLKMAYKPNQEQLNTALEDILTGEPPVDLVISGKNGDGRYDHFYDHIISRYFPKTAVKPFKNLCGDYDTAAAFALWMAVQDRSWKRVLIYNHYFGEQHTFMLLSRNPQPTPPK